MRVTKRMTGRYQLRLRAFNTIPVPAPYNTSKEILITLIVEEYPGGNTYKRAQRIRVHVPTKIRYLYGPTMPTLVAVITYARFCRRVCKMTSRCFCGLLTHCLPTSGTVCLRHALTATSRTICLHHAPFAYVTHSLPTSCTVCLRHALSTHVTRCLPSAYVTRCLPTSQSTYLRHALSADAVRYRLASRHIVTT